MRYSLRTLLVGAILGPPLLAGGFLFLSTPRGIWMLQELANALPFVGVVGIALLLVHLLGRASKFPLE